jgi:hypothetical protein
MRTRIQLLNVGRSPGQRGSRRRPADSAAILVAALLAAIVGCGDDQATTGGIGMQALVVGHLVADPETGCVGLTETPEVKDPWGTPVKWPEGIQARTDPVRLIGPDGTVIAREGDVVHVVGGSTSANASPEPPCTERPFIAHEIEKVEPKNP